MKAELTTMGDMAKYRESSSSGLDGLRSGGDARYAFSPSNALWHSSIHSNAFILVIPFLVVVHWGMVVVAFTAALFVILMVHMLFVPLAQLSFQLMILLGWFRCYSFH